MEKVIHLIWRFIGLVRQANLSLIVCGMLLGISWAGTGVAGTDLDRVLNNIEARHNSLRTFTADFKQIQQSHLFHQAQVSEGMLFFDYTGKMLMHMIQPHAFILLIAEDMTGLFRFAEDLGYTKSPKGYVSKCDLCLDLRSYLVSKADWKELKPAEFYTHLE